MVLVAVSTPIILPWPLRSSLEATVRALLEPGDRPPIDFSKPIGEPALVSPDSVSWRVFKNPLSLFIGGVAAVIMELAKPRVRTGVWEHTTFRLNPIKRLRRTGFAAMVTIYGARSAAEAKIAWQIAVARDPAFAEAWYNLAVVAVELGQYGNARMALDEVLARSPDDRQARALLEQVDRSGAGVRAVSADVSAATERRCAVAKRAVDEGRYADAIVWLQVAAWFDEESPLPHHYLANVYYLTGRLAEATRHQREALARAPQNELYQRNLAALEEAGRK